MAKDTEGRFHRIKGKPSARGNEKGLSTGASNDNEVNQQQRLEDKYDIDVDREQAKGVRMKHPNRNTIEGGKEMMSLNVRDCSYDLYSSILVYAAILA